MDSFNIKLNDYWRLLGTFIVCLLLSGLSHLQAQQSDEETYEANVLAFIDAAYNHSNLSLLDTLFATDYAYHPGGFDVSRLRINILSLRAAVPDLQATPIIHIAEGDWVAVHLYLHGTFTNDFIAPGIEPITATQQPLQLVTNMVFHFNEQGQIYQQWVTFDNLNYLAQLDMIDFDALAWQGTTEAVSLYPLTDGEDSQRLAALQYYDAFSQKNSALLQSLLSESFAGYNPFGSFDQAGQLNDLNALFGAFPDLEVRIDALIVDGTYVAALYNMHGTFTQNYVFADGSALPPTNKRLDLIRIDFLQFNQQTTIEQSIEIYDGLDFMVQLGILPVTTAP